MQRSRAIFKQSLRSSRNIHSKTQADSLAKKLLSKDTKKFWSEVKKLTGKSSTPTATTIGKVSGTEAITEQWRNHYHGLLNSLPMTDEAANIKATLETCSNDNCTFSFTDCSEAISKLKLDKASGIDYLSSEHFKHASSKLCIMLCMCFNAMLLHGHIPKQLSNTILLPIIKDKKGNISDLDNYRPIAITTVASKIFEQMILSKVQSLLLTSDNQFSFKAKSSTDMAVFTVKSVIDMYKVSSSPVYICLLDASKAFDRINYWYLFRKLVERNMAAIYVRFLMCWYCTQEFTIRWCNKFSAPFTVSNGVRQGSILSPLLFNIYLNDLSDILNKCKVGCIVNDVLINHLMYADDLVLLAPSAHALQVLVGHCEAFASEHDIIFNTKKSVCMCMKPSKFKYDFNYNVVLCGSLLKNVSCQKYLGVLLSNDCKDDNDIKQQCKNLYSRGNILIRNFNKCTDEVKCLLFKTFCSNIYCSALWNKYNVESMRQLKVGYNRVFRILLRLEHRVSMSANFISRRLDPFPVVLRKSISSFRTRILYSGNILLRAIVDSDYFTFCSLSKHWKSNIFALH